MFINDKLKFVYVSATKSGSSSMNQRLKNQFGGRSLGNATWVIPTECEDYYSFMVVRNPYSRMVSWWNSVIKVDGDRYGHKRELHQHKLTESLADFLRLWEIKGDYSQSKYLEVNKRIDQVLKLENIDEEFLTLPFVTHAAPLPHINKRKASWKELLDDESKELINRIYGKDFENFGYDKI